MMTFGTMDLCPFVKVLVAGLALRILVASKPTREGIHSLRFPCFCNIKFKFFWVYIVIVPLISDESLSLDILNLVEIFHLEHSNLLNISKILCLVVSNQ